jgi:sugar phosphate isomerase/epimerase
MNNVFQTLAVQSYCFRGFTTNEEVIEQVKKIGLSHIELCGVHADFSKEETFDQVINLYKNAGVKIVSIGVQTMANNPPLEKKYFEFAKRAGAKHISISFDLKAMPDCIPAAMKLADAYDINLGIHNHGGWHWLGNSEMLGHLFKHNSPRLGLCLDTAWMLDSGENPIKVAERFADRLYAVHIKDFVFDRARKPEDVVVGTGNLDLKALVEIIKTKAPAGCCPILEYEGDIANPAPALRQCVEAVHKVA